MRYLYRVQMGRFWNVRSPDKDVRTWKRQRGFTEEEKRNLGFSITVNLENTNDQNICICFRGKDVQKIYTVNVKKIKRENTGLYQQMKLLSLKNRQKNQEYIKKNGIGRFIRYVEKFPA